MRKVTREDLPGALRALAVLADETRFRLASMVAREPMTVSDLADELDLSQPLISFHLRRLRAAGLVRSRRAGRSVYYSLHRAPIERLARLLEHMLPEDIHM